LPKSEIAVTTFATAFTCFFYTFVSTLNKLIMKKILASVIALSLFSLAAKSQINAVITANSSNICQGTQAILNANPTGGSYSYQWLLNNAPVNGAVSSAYSTLVGGDFSCIITDGVYTDTSNMVTITVNPNPVVSLPPNSTICSGNTIQLCATGNGLSYQWSNGGNTPCINVSAAGVYYVTVTDQYGCTGSANTVITVMPPLSATLSGTNDICMGDQANIIINFTGLPPFTYSYSNGTTTFGPFTTSNNPTIISVSPTVSTSYSLTAVSDVCGNGTVSGTAIITVHLLPTVMATSTGSLTFCVGDSVLLTAFSSSVTYQWYRNSIAIPAGTSQTYYAKRAGDYVCIVTSIAWGCLSTPSFPIHVSVPCVHVNPPDLRPIMAEEEAESAALLTHSNAGIDEEASAYFLFNAMGVLVEKGIAGNKKTALDFENRQPGIYFLKLVYNNNSVVTRRIIR
jgi:hypothetical protein